jgi:hypothetical protein
MDRAVHAASAQEPGVRGVHDRVDVLFGEITFDQMDARHPDIVRGRKRCNRSETHMMDMENLTG